MTGPVLERFAKSTNPRSFGFRARQRRMEALLERFPDFPQMRIVDLGGDTRYWKAQSIRPAHVTIVAIEPWAIADLEPWMDGVIADACDADSIDGQFDLVFSNSVIEHVGGPRYRRGFAETVHRLGPRHWIQTPNRYFLLEPHFRFPGFQFLPPAVKVFLARRWKGSVIAGRDDIEPVAYVMDHELLGRTELRALFPGSELVAERVLGMPKSFVVVRES